MSRTALYRHYDANGDLLYVGISLSIVARTAQHAESAVWFQEIAQIAVEWHDTRQAASDAEKVAIASEKPAHNRTHAVTNDVKRFCADVGVATLASRLSLGVSSVSNACLRGTMPASWARAVAFLCREHGTSYPQSGFNWRGASGTSACVTELFPAREPAQAAE